MTRSNFALCVRSERISVKLARRCTEWARLPFAPSPVCPKRIRGDAGSENNKILVKPSVLRQMTGSAWSMPPSVQPPACRRSLRDGKSWSELFPSQGQIDIASSRVSFRLLLAWPQLCRDDEGSGIGKCFLSLQRVGYCMIQASIGAASCMPAVIRDFIGNWIDRYCILWYIRKQVS